MTQDVYHVSPANWQPHRMHKSNPWELSMHILLLPTGWLGWLFATHQILFQQLEKFLHPSNSILCQSSLSPIMGALPHQILHYFCCKWTCRMIGADLQRASCWIEACTTNPSILPWHLLLYCIKTTTWPTHLAPVTKYQDYMTCQETRPPLTASLSCNQENWQQHICS